jgi:hypothetical protein
MIAPEDFDLDIDPYQDAICALVDAQAVEIRSRLRERHPTLAAEIDDAHGMVVSRTATLIGEALKKIVVEIVAAELKTAYAEAVPGTKKG